MPETSEKAPEDICASCRRPKISTRCEICHSLLCKNCAQFLDASVFSFLKNVPEDLAHPSYCGLCYDAKVAPALESYSEVMERAREVGVFYKNERNLPPHRRSNKMLSVQNCPDRKETLLRLAFFAAEQSCNALVNVDLRSKKIIIGGYQKTFWNGAGFSAHVFVEKKVKT